MFQAVETPLLKVAALAGAAVLAGMFATASPDPVTQQLRLHAPKRARAVYATQWERGDITITLPDGVPRTMTFHKKDHQWGCDWESTEIIVPDGPGRYWYSYDEVKLNCEPCAPPSITTPRTGWVEVVAQDD